MGKIYKDLSDIDLKIARQYSLTSFAGKYFKVFFVCDEEPLTTWLRDCPRIFSKKKNALFIPVLAAKASLDNFSVWQWPELCFINNEQRLSILDKKRFKEQHEISLNNTQVTNLIAIVGAEKIKSKLAADLFELNIINYELMFGLMRAFVSNVDSNARLMFCDANSPLQQIECVIHFIKRILAVDTGALDYFCESRFMAYCHYGATSLKYKYDSSYNFYDRKALLNIIKEIETNTFSFIPTLGGEKEAKILEVTGLL